MLGRGRGEGGRSGGAKRAEHPARRGQGAGWGPDRAHWEGVEGCRAGGARYEVGGRMSSLPGHPLSILAGDYLDPGYHWG